MKKLFVITFVLVILLTLITCSEKSSKTTPETTKKLSVSPTMLDGFTAEEALVLANKWKTSNPEVSSYITPENIVFEFPDKMNVEIPLPGDSMMIAIAPYVDKTHSCSTHYISGCQGELVDVPVKVLAVKNDGTVLIDQTLTTMSNGFIELWFPRDIDITLTMESMTRKAEGQLTTFSDSNTCITSMQLL